MFDSDVLNHLFLKEAVSKIQSTKSRVSRLLVAYVLIRQQINFHLFHFFAVNSSKWARMSISVKKIRGWIFFCRKLTLKLPEHFENSLFLTMNSVCIFVSTLAVIYWPASITNDTSPEAENFELSVTIFRFSDIDPWEKIQDEKVLSQQKIALRHTQNEKYANYCD